MKLTKALILACADKAALDLLWTETNTDCVEVTECRRCERCERCTQCEDCLNVDNSTNCVNCQNLGNAHDCTNCKGYTDALKMRKLYKCTNCLSSQRVAYMDGATDAKNMVMGIQFTADEFNQIWTRLGFNGAG